MWWKSTEIYRAEVPHALIEELSLQNLHLTPFQIYLDFIIYQNENDLSSSEKKSLEGFIDDFFQSTTSSSYQVKVTSNISYSKPLSVPLENIEEIDKELLSQLKEGQNGRYSIVLLPTSSSSYSTPKIYLSAHRHLFVIYQNNEKSKNVSFYQNNLFPILLNAISSTFISTTTSDSDKMVEVRSSPEYKITFSLLQDSTGWPTPFLSWPFSQFHQRYLEKFLKKVGLISEFTVDSQIKHFVPLLREPSSSASSNEFYFSPSDLPYILSHPNEWNSDFTSTWQPSLNFILYVPNRFVSPLFLRTDREEKSKTNGFLIPQTGGIVILNRHTNSSSLEDEDMHQAMQVFISQLRQLIGVSDFNRFIGKYNIDRILPSYYDGISNWEVDLLLRKRTFENIQYTTTTLLSLSEMIQKLTRMVILDNIQSIVLDSISALQHSTECMSKRDFESAQKQSMIAMKKAREAFFDPNMLGILYFPDEHIFAVYAPLFLPISYPFFSKLFSELRKRKEKRKRKEELEKEKKSK